MEPTTKSTKERKKDEIKDVIMPVYEKGVDQMAELQKKSLETTAQQNAKWMEACKEVLHLMPGTPAMFCLEFTSKGVENCIEMQKAAIDLLMEQSRAAVALVNEGVETLSVRADGMTDVCKRSVEQVVAAQKKSLSFLTEQSKIGQETAKKQAGGMANPMAESFQRGLDMMIEMQDSMLDAVSKPWKANRTSV